MSRDSQSFQAYLGRLDQNYQTTPDLRFDKFLAAVLECQSQAPIVLSYDRAVASKNLMTQLALLCEIDLQWLSKEIDSMYWERRSQRTLDIEINRLINGARAHQLGEAPNALFDTSQQYALFSGKYSHFPNLVSNLLSRDGLSAQLCGTIRETQKTIRLTRKKYYDLETSLEQQLKQCQTTAIENDFFPEVAETSGKYSDLDYLDLTGTVKQNLDNFVYSSYPNADI